jgi:adhesin transport system outer membrane protein
LAETRQAVALSVVQAYYQMVLTAQRNEILIAGREALVDLTESIGRRVEQGVSAAADRILAQSRVSQLEQNIASNQAQYFSAQERYRQFTGDPAATLTEVPVYSPATAHPAAEGALEELLACDPKRQRIQAETQVAFAAAKIARAQLLPSLSAQFQQSEVLGTRYGLALRAQTSGGLSGVSAAQSAQIRAENNAFLIALNDREARDALRQDLIENSSSRVVIEASGNAAVAARDLTESYRRQFTTGRKTWQNVVDAERDATNAAISESEAEVSAMNSAARILLRTCRWQP